MDGHSEMNVVKRDVPVEAERPDAENAQVTIARPAEEEQTPNNVSDANAEPWTPSQLDRALLSQAWKLNVPLPKKLLILDVNGLLVARYSKSDRSVIPMHAPHGVVSRSYMFKRPFCDSFLAFCFENFDVGLWSSMMQANVFRALDFICQGWQDKCRFVMHQGDCTNTGLKNPEKKTQPLFLKELTNVWSKFPQFNETNTLLIDDTPYKALRNPPYTAIFPEAYLYNEADIFLKGPLVEYLTQLRDAVDVREFVRAHPIGLPALAPGSLHWDFFQQVLETKAENVSPLNNTRPLVTVVPQAAPSRWDFAEETKAENVSRLNNPQPLVTLVPQAARTRWDIAETVVPLAARTGWDFAEETKAENVSRLNNPHPLVTVGPQAARTRWDFAEETKAENVSRLNNPHPLVTVGPQAARTRWDFAEETKAENVSRLNNPHPLVTVGPQAARTRWDFAEETKAENVSRLNNPHPLVTVGPQAARTRWDFAEETKAENVSRLNNPHPLVTVGPQAAPSRWDFAETVVPQAAPSRWDFAEETKAENVSRLNNPHPLVTVGPQAARTRWDFAETVVPQAARTRWDFAETEVPQVASTGWDFAERENEIGEPLPPGTY